MKSIMGIQNCDYPRVSRECQTWRLRLFENRAMESIFESVCVCVCERERERGGGDSRRLEKIAS